MALMQIVEMCRDGKAKISNFHWTTDNGVCAVALDVTETVGKPTPSSYKPVSPMPSFNPWEVDSWNLAAQAKYIEEWGEDEAKKAAAAGGVVLGATRAAQPFIRIVSSAQTTWPLAILPTQTFEQRLVESISGRRIDHFEMSSYAYELLCKLGLCREESSPAMMRGFPCEIGSRVPTASELAAASERVIEAEAKRQEKAAAAEVERKKAKERFEKAAEKERIRLAEIAEQERIAKTIAPKQERQLIFDD